jgi:hypothetical protein
MVTIVGPKGEELATLTADEAAHVFEFPAFGGASRYFGLRQGEHVVRFDVAAEGLERLKVFLNQSVVDAGPEAVDKVRRRASRDLLVGLGFIAAGCIATITSYQAAASKPEGGTFTVWYGMVVFGAIVVVKGFMGYSRHGKLQRMGAMS